MTELTETALDVTWVEGEPSAGVAGASVLRYELIRDGAALAVVEGGTRFTDTELRAGTVHCYRVVAVGAEGHRSAPSPEACGAARDVLPPTVPGRVTAVVENPSSVALSWPPSEDDSGRVWYEVYDGDAHLVTLRATSWTHTGAAAQEHRYSVCAMDDAGNRSVAAEFTRVSLGDVEPPTAPRGLTLTAVSPTQIELTWTPSSDNIGVAHYEVLTGGEPFLRSDGTTALASPLTEWEEHCLSIRAVDGAGNRSEPSTVVCSRTMDRAFWKARNEAGARESRRRM